MSENERLIQVGKSELLKWACNIFEKELTWKSFSDGDLILDLCFLVWPSLKNKKTGMDSLSDSWRQIEAIFRTLSIDYSNLIDEDGIKNNKLSSAYNALIIFFFLFHCAFKRESSFEFIPPPSKNVADFLTGDSSVKSLIIGGSLQLSPKTQIRLFETDSKSKEMTDDSRTNVGQFKVDESTYYDKIQRFNELMEMDDRTIRLVENLNLFFEGLNKKLIEVNNEEMDCKNEQNDDFNMKIRRCIEYCVKQLVRTKEEQAIERESYEKNVSLMEEECEKKINQLKIEYEDKIRDIENEFKNKLIHEKKSSQSMLRTLQNNQAFNLQISNSICSNDNVNDENESDNKSGNDNSNESNFDSLKQLKYLQDIMKEESKKRDEIERILNDEIKNYKIENRKLKSIIFRYITDVSTNTPLFERINCLNDQFTKIYTMAELWWKRISDGNMNGIQERIDINYKMERMRMDKMIGYIKHIIDRYQQNPKSLNKIGLDKDKASDSGFEFEVLVQNNNLVNDCLKIICDLLSDTLLKSNRIDQLKEFIMNIKHKNNDEKESDDENYCYCNFTDTFGDVYGKLVCSDEKKQLKEKVSQLNHEKLLLKKGIEYLKKKIYTLKNQKIILSSVNNDGNLDLMSDIDNILNNSGKYNDDTDIIDVSKLWEISNYLKEDGINELNIMSEFMAITDSWKNLFNQIYKEDCNISFFDVPINSKGIDENDYKMKLSKSDFTIRDLGIIPFITNSNQLLEVAIENENITGTNIFEKGKQSIDYFDIESDFDKEVEMISKMALKKEFNTKIKKEEFSAFPSSLKKIEILFWKLVTCLYILREEYEMIHKHCNLLEKRIEAIISKMEEEKSCCVNKIRESREQYENNLTNIKNELLNEIGKLKGEITLNKIQKSSELNNNEKNESIELMIKENIKNSNTIIDSVCNALEVSNVYRYIYQVCDEFWRDIMYKIKDNINEDDKEKINTILSQMEGVKDYLKEYTEKNYKEKNIGEYISSKVMEIRDNNNVKSDTIKMKMSNFLNDLAIRNNIPLDWMNFIELIVNTKTMELNNEIMILNEKINNQQDVIDNIKQRYTDMSSLNNQNESTIEKMNYDYKILEDKLSMSIKENENLKTNNNLIKNKFKELDLYYNKQLIDNNKKLNYLEKICMLSMKYGIELNNFRNIYLINDFDSKDN